MTMFSVIRPLVGMVFGVLTTGAAVGVGVHSVQPQGVITEQVGISIVLVGIIVTITWRMAYKMGWTARGEKYVDEELTRLRDHAGRTERND